MKRVYQPKSKSGKRKRKHGFRTRMKNNSEIFNQRRRKGRKRISI